MEPWPRKWCVIFGLLALAIYGKMLVQGGITPSSAPRIGAAAEDWQTRVVGALGVAAGLTLLHSGIWRKK